LEKYLDDSPTRVQITSSVLEIGNVVDFINKTKREREETLQLVQLTNLLQNGKSLVVREHIPRIFV
jgi:hypothetical protein